jgi:poly(3-hydroxybutyrate) depolymerase
MSQLFARPTRRGSTLRASPQGAPLPRCRRGLSRSFRRRRGPFRNCSRNISTLFQARSAMKNGVNTESDVRGTTAAPLPTIVFHGDQDETVHPSNASCFVSTLQRSSDVPLQIQEVTGRSDGGRDFTRSLYRIGNGKALLERWMIHGSGHAWSGGKVTGSYTDPAGPDASREIARFFLARRRPPGGKALRA